LTINRQLQNNNISVIEENAFNNLTSLGNMWVSLNIITERSDLGDNFCRSLFVLCPLDILLSVRLRFMDSDYLFGIFKLVLHIKSKELLDFMWMVIMKRKCKLRWPTVLSKSKKRTITPKTPHHISVSAITFTGNT
jgi:hypothetical protein